MKIAVISDTHSQHSAVESAITRIDAAQVELTIHCGDITDAETVWLFQPNTHFVWGNCDTEKTSLRQAIFGIGAVCHDFVGSLEVGGKRLAFCHGDDLQLLDDLIHSDGYDFVFHGHTHTAADRVLGPTRIINPGAMTRIRHKTFAFLDLINGELESVVVP